MRRTKTPLSPCPFCGEVSDKAGQLRIAVTTTKPSKWDRGMVASVECFQCGAKGPDSLSEEDAIENWNQRATK